MCVSLIEMEDTEVKKLVNKIFAMKGLPKVTNFAQEFSNGGKYQSALDPISLRADFHVMWCYRALPSAIQHFVRGEHRLQTLHVCSAGGQIVELEPPQRQDLFQLPAAGVLFGEAYDAQSRPGQELASCPKAPAHPHKH